MSGATAYLGQELELFAEAHRWKRYLRSELGKYLRGRVLEVGAGEGATTRALFDVAHVRWTCLEPDPELASKLTQLRAELPADLREKLQVRIGTLAEVGSDEVFDTILYVDVLEHIEDDRAELACAASRLAKSGSLIVLAPAHAFLFSPFDAAIGHYRRYDRASLTALCPPGTRIVRLRYLDSIGIAASLANRLLLRASQPTLAQIKLWDRALVPLSRAIDPLLGHRVGKSILAVFRAS